MYKDKQKKIMFIETKNYSNWLEDEYEHISIGYSRNKTKKISRNTLFRPLLWQTDKTHTHTKKKRSLKYSSNYMHGI